MQWTKGEIVLVKGYLHGQEGRKPLTFRIKEVQEKYVGAVPAMEEDIQLRVGAFAKEAALLLGIAMTLDDICFYFDAETGWEDKRGSSRPMTMRIFKFET